MSKTLKKQWKTVKAGMFEAQVRPQKYFHLPGINDQTVGSEQIAVNLVVLPPGAVAKGHIHHTHETVIFVLDGWSLTYMGPDHEEAVAGPGEFLFIPKDVEHLATNLSTTKPVVGLICRSDPQLYTNLELLPHIDEVVAKKIDEARKRHEAGELPRDWKTNYRDDFNLDGWKAMWLKMTNGEVRE
jgi:uncharacterized RmlC-like cupin family protein